MRPPALSAAKERILLALKTKGPQPAPRLARNLGVTPMAIRQHLASLGEEGLVEYEDVRGRVGRPKRVWRLADSEKVDARFPDSHAELTLGLLDAARAAFGEKGIDRLIRERGKRQLADYRRRIPVDAPLPRRLAALAAVRRDEGYMAEWSREKDGSYLFVESHCPICAAARACRGLCRGELELFRKLLGPEASVQRAEYLLEGGRRCVYRVEPA